MKYTVEPIGIVHSCYKEKFAIPRQSGLAPASTGIIEILSDYSRREAFNGLEECSHIWVEFIFHAGFKSGGSASESWSPTVRPPRLGGNQRLGVFATRSPNRPNKLGLSVVKLERITVNNGLVSLHISGHDLLEGTPVLDIKPYVPYADSIPQARNQWADKPPQILRVTFSEPVLQVLQTIDADAAVNLRALIEQVLQQDPRPSYQSLDEDRIYGVNLSDWQVRWRYQYSCAKLQDDALQEIVVVELAPIK